MSGSGPSKHLRLIKRRIVWLQQRVNTSTFNNTFDKAEIEALTWAVNQIEANPLPTFAHRVKETNDYNEKAL